VKYKIEDLQTSVRDKNAFTSIDDYFLITNSFISFLEKTSPTKIVAPNNDKYIFYQYGKKIQHKITRPLNSDLLIFDSQELKISFERFIDLLSDSKKSKGKMKARYLKSNECNKIIYTLQQAIGCVGDSFPNPNQSRKRIGQLFENLIRLIIKELGLNCESRTISVPIPNNDGYEMSYELDLVFSQNKAIITSETKELIQSNEIIGSVKTTSKDRIDKVFLDKFLLSKFLGRDIPVIAIFLHDVQRAKRGNSIFGINSTFKTKHFLGYTVALNRLDGVYYVDPRPIMLKDKKLSKEIKSFQQFIFKDIWQLTKHY